MANGNNMIWLNATVSGTESVQTGPMTSHSVLLSQGLPTRKKNMAEYVLHLEMHVSKTLVVKQYWKLSSGLQTTHIWVEQEFQGCSGSRSSKRNYPVEGMH
jgi:hypothetical protein